MAENKYHFERLTPIDNMDLDVYEEAIDYVFNNPDVKNVAISGAYSAGKSSVLASYKKRHNDLRFLHISLAHFKSPDQEDETEVKESVLEGKILNQLIHQIPPDKIPQTNFRVKRKISPASIIKSTLASTALLTAIIYFLFFDSWKSYVSTLPANWLKSIFKLSVHPYALMVDGIIIFCLWDHCVGSRILCYHVPLYGLVKTAAKDFMNVMHGMRRKHLYTAFFYFTAYSLGL